MRKQRLKEDAPVQDWLPSDFKDAAKEKAMQRAREKGASSSNFGNILMDVGSSERGKTEQLLRLAMKSLFQIYPRLKEIIDAGEVRIDAKLHSGAGGRITSQNVDAQKLARARESDPDFDQKVRKREIVQALTQGISWETGFNYIHAIKSSIDSIDPNLYEKYKKFSEGASAYYWGNTEDLERMASRASGRIAYADVRMDDRNPNVVLIDVAAPNFPLLLHELIKGVEMYKNRVGLPKDPDVRQALVKLTDTHKGEIQSMNYGRELVSKLRDLLADINEYEIDMEAEVTHHMMKMPETQFLQLWDEIISGNTSVAKTKLRDIVRRII
jgi:hypothetical protein